MKFKKKKRIILVPTAVILIYRHNYSKVNKVHGLDEALTVRSRYLLLWIKVIQNSHYKMPSLLLARLKTKIHTGRDILKRL